MVGCPVKKRPSFFVSFERVRSAPIGASKSSSCLGAGTEHVVSDKKHASDSGHETKWSQRKSLLVWIIPKLTKHKPKKTKPGLGLRVSLKWRRGHQKRSKVGPGALQGYLVY